MATTEYTVMPESSTWEDSIYLLDPLTDRALGYNPNDDTDGPANTQWQQLTNRTRFLRTTFEVEHNPDGTHNIKGDDLAEGTVIDESQLKLSEGTQALADAIAAEKDKINALLETSQNINGNSVDIAKCLAKLLPIVQSYTVGAGAYELFIDGFTLMNNKTYNLCLRDKLNYAEIVGDDSLDLETVEGLEVGETYVIHDGKGNDSETATIMKILEEDKRVRFTTPLKYTREHGVLSCSDLVANDDGAQTNSGNFSYQTDYLTTLVDYNSGSLSLNRDWDGKSTVTPQAWYNVLGSDEWIEIPLSSTTENSDGTCTDYWSYIPGKNPVRFRIQYTGDKQTYTVHYIVLSPNVSYTRIDTVRQPWVVSARYSYRNLSIVGSPYGTLYEVPHALTRMRLMSAPYVTDPYFLYEYNTPVTSITLQVPPALYSCKTLYIQLQYTDREGADSRWSDVYALEV